MRLQKSADTMAHLNKKDCSFLLTVMWRTIEKYTFKTHLGMTNVAWLCASVLFVVANQINYVGKQFSHQHFEVYHREENKFSVVLMLSSKVHSCSVKSLKRVKTFVVIEGQRLCFLNLFENREILIKYGNKTNGTIPVTLLVLESCNKLGVNELSCNTS